MLKICTEFPDCFCECVEQPVRNVLALFAPGSHKVDVPLQVSARRVTASAKKDIHPELLPSKVICNGEEVAELTGTQSEYHVEVWSGNHPFYRGDSSALVLDEGQV